MSPGAWQETGCWASSGGESGGGERASRGDSSERKGSNRRGVKRLCYERFRERGRKKKLMHERLGGCVRGFMCVGITPALG